MKTKHENQNHRTLQKRWPFPKVEIRLHNNPTLSTPAFIHQEIVDAKLTLKPLPTPLKKQFEGQLFQEYVDEPRAFTALINSEQVGWIELGYHKRNNRMRIWQFLVKEEHRRKGIGTQLMQHTLKLAKERGARTLVLETQSCNVVAIKFYLAHGFQLIGFDTTA